MPHMKKLSVGGFAAALPAAALAAALFPAAAWSQGATTTGTGTAGQTPVVLGPVVVTATATEHDLLTSPSFTTVIGREEIDNAPPATGLPDLLRDFVGIDNSSDNLGRDDVVVRGLGAGYTLILVNGKRVSSSSALWRGGDFDYSSIPLAAIERVEIVRGPMSSLYGADAIGGVINIITRKPDQEEWTGNIGLDYRYVTSGDGGSEYGGNFFLTGPLLDTLSASFAGEFSDRDAWYTHSKSNGTVPALEEKVVKNITADLNWAVTDGHDVDLHYGFNKDDRPYNLYDDDPDYREQEITRHTVNLSHTGRWSWGTTLLEGNYEHGEIDDFNTAYNAPQQRELIENNTFLHGRVTIPFSSGNLMTGGVEYRNQLVEDEATYLRTGEMELTQLAVYLQDEITLLDDLTLTLGGRLDDHEFFGDHFTSRANLVYQIVPGVALKGGISEGFKAPNAYQLSEEYSIVSCGGACFLSGNPNLKPELSRSVEAGIEVQQADWDLSAAVFRNNVKDMIIAVYDPAGPSREWQNVNTVKLQGAEVSGSVDIADGLALSGNYAYLVTIDSDGEDLDNRPHHTGALTVSWEFVPDFTVVGSAYYHGAQNEGNNRLPSYQTFDIGLVADVREDLRIKAGVQNLTDVILTEKNENFLQHELGRNVYLSAIYQF